MFPGVRRALLRFDQGDFVTHDDGRLVWNTGGVLGWGTWAVLRNQMFIIKRGREWHVSPRGSAKARGLRLFGSVQPGE